MRIQHATLTTSIAIAVAPASGGCRAAAEQCEHKHCALPRRWSLGLSALAGLQEVVGGGLLRRVASHLLRNTRVGWDGMGWDGVVGGVHSALLLQRFASHIQKAGIEKLHGIGSLRYCRLLIQCLQANPASTLVLPVRLAYSRLVKRIPGWVKRWPGTFPGCAAPRNAALSVQ